MEEEQMRIRRVLDGDTEAYRELLERYQTGVIIYCENITKSRADAEDIAQESFIRAYQNLHRFQKDKARFSTWIYKIATNLCIDLMRKNRHQIDVEDIEAHMEASMPQHADNDDIRHLRKIIETLDPPKYADIIKGYFWEGKSYQILAQEHGTTTGTIGTWLTRAKVQLKEKML